jgi:hypothetical protein
MQYLRNMVARKMTRQLAPNLVDREQDEPTFGIRGLTGLQRVGGQEQQFYQAPYQHSSNPWAGPEALT